MKKIFALIIAITAIFGTFTSCGKDESENSSGSVSEVSESIPKSSDESSESETESATTEVVTTTATEKSTTIAETTSVKTTAAETTQAVTTEIIKTDISENLPSETEIENADEYISTLKNLFDAEINSDTMKMLELSFPKDVFEAMNKAGMLDFMVESIGDVENSLAMEELDNYESANIKVVSVRDIESDELESVKKEYSKIKGLCDCLINAGVTYDIILSGNMPDNLTNEEMLKLAEDVYFYSNENSDIEITVDFQSYKYVTFAFNNEIVKIELPMFITDDTAKIDLMMIGHSYQNN